jgi:hypothetical protein
MQGPLKMSLESSRIGRTLTARRNLPLENVDSGA